MNNKFKLSEIKSNPKNPRFIKDDKFNKLVNSIILFPEMMSIRPIVVDENNIALGGNMRDRACLEIKNLGKDHCKDLIRQNNCDTKRAEKILQLILPLFEGFFPEGWIKKVEELSTDQKEEFIAKDNIPFGDWDWDILANEWNSENLEKWGLDLKFPIDSEDEELPEEQTYIPVFRFEVTCSTEAQKNKLMAELLTQGYSCTEDY